MGSEMAIFDPTQRDSADDALRELQEENKRLARALQDANVRADRASEDAQRAMGALRKQLTPLFRALQSVFGELDAAGVGDDAPGPAPSAAPADDRVRAVWENWKQKLGVGPAKCIDALLLHREMTTQQLSIATGYHRNTVPQYVSALHKAGLINKNGGRFSLKTL